ncbi:DNA-binding anti-repressor SinI [Priestia megaterium]|uniref:DNA-binding anti-repressor SinI n=1 Tax=Priestia megaterium TaxID=1404 RepID=UPI00366EB057
MGLKYNIRGEKKFDQEWISLINEAYYLGLSIEEVKEFIYSKQKKLFLNDSGSFCFL